MPPEPARKRAIAFVDGQNLFYAAKEAFGFSYPNYDAPKLANAVCAAQGWELVRTRFYTGVPDRSDSPFWSRFWEAKLAAMGTRGVDTYCRTLRYRNKVVRLPDGTAATVLVGQEKGIDIRLALDVVAGALDGSLDVALVFSQDQDLSEVAEEIRSISRQQNRWIKIACAYPCSPTSRNTRGIDKTDWIRIDRASYEACIDRIDYRPGHHPQS